MHVFVDTERFVAVGFNFHTREMSKLRAHAASKTIHLITTSLTNQEIEKRLKVAAATLYPKVNQLRKGAAANLVTGLADLLKNVTEAKLERLLHAKYVELIRNHTTLLDIGTVKLDDIVRDYFEEHAPFDNSDKKSEFPDAIAAKTLLSWARHQKHIVHVISGDDDWSRICHRHPKHLKHYKNVYELCQELGNPGQVAFIQAGLQAETAAVAEGISRAFNELSFEWRDVQGSVFSANPVAVNVGDSVVFESSDSTARAIVDCQVTFEASGDFDDPDSWVRDEDGNIHYRHRTMITDEVFVCDFDAICDVTFDLQKESELTVALVDLTASCVELGQRTGHAVASGS